MAGIVNALLDSIFDQLEDRLPPDVYATLLSVTSNIMALSMVGARAIAFLLANLTKSWDLQSILPPILTLLAAYIALTGFYRTTSWAFRTTFWFLKWGSIAGILSVGAGWLAAVTQMNGNGGQQDVAVVLGNLGSKAAGWLSGQGTKASTRPRSPRKEGSRNNRPWNIKSTRPNQNPYRQRAPQSDLEEAQKIMNNIVESANQIFEGNWWWEMGKGMMGSGGQAEEQTRKKSQGRTRSR